jgi:hypothetical protein
MKRYPTITEIVISPRPLKPIGYKGEPITYEDMISQPCMYRNMGFQKEGSIIIRDFIIQEKNPVIKEVTAWSPDFYLGNLGKTFVYEAQTEPTSKSDDSLPDSLAEKLAHRMDNY